MKTVLLCTDLDRTILPNGKEPESPGAREIFSAFAAHPQLRLAYVSGRDRRLIEDAITEYELPVPDYLIGDVGTTLYRQKSGEWVLDQAWQEAIGNDWNGLKHHDIVELLSNKLDKNTLRLQPDAKQNTYKVSYFTDPEIDYDLVKESVSPVLGAKAVKANLIWSVDEAENVGLLDILPQRANKLEAIRFLVKSEGHQETDTVFAGDSGNDLDVLVSGLQAILVKNGHDKVRKEAVSRLQNSEQASRLYLAKGGAFGMNGNYSSGVIEGLLHFFPACHTWLNGS